MLARSACFVAVALAILWGVVGQRAAVAQSPEIPDIPILLRADEMRYDRELGIVTATGNVEVSQENRILLADTISYNQKQDVITASGNVSLLEPTGDVLFAEYMQITGDMKDGIIRDLRLRLSDNARIAAVGARRSGGQTLDMRKAVYSPCDLCRDNPERPPLWQVKAQQVTHDQRTKTIEYKDAWLEFEGVPVAYTPYLSHPDPTVRRRSGLLAPSFGNSSDLGFVLQTPVFWDIDPQKDATVTPLITSGGSVGVIGEYRERLKDGEYHLTSSVVHDAKEDVRGHVIGRGRFDIDETWRGGFDVERATDDTYLRRYGFGSERTLTSRLFAEGFRRRNYFTANAYAFQGLQQSDDPGQTPLVLPLVDYNHVGSSDRLGGRTSLDANLLALTRADGTDTRRFSVDGGWKLPHIDSSGTVFELSADVRGDVYHVNSLERENGTEFSGVSGRFFPQVALQTSYPLVRVQGPLTQVIEPKVQFVASPYGGNSEDIPNEDSQDLEFDDTNLFTTNRFTGLDRVETGPRVNYGVEWGIFGAGGGRTSVVVGQSYRLKDDATFPEDSGLGEHASDIVAMIHAAPGEHFDLIYRTRLDRHNLEARRNEALLQVGPPSLRLAANYLFFDRQRGTGFPDREEITTVLHAQLTRYWRTRTSMVRDLTDDGGLRSLNLAFIYEDECFVFSADARRTFYQDRDIKPTDSVVLRVVFKTLGDIETSVR